MGVMDKVRGKFGKKSREKFECVPSEDGSVACRLFREFDDKSQQELASESFRMDQNCVGIANSMIEHEPGALDRLEKKAYKRIRDKCKTTNKPQDY